MGTKRTLVVGASWIHGVRGNPISDIADAVVVTLLLRVLQRNDVHFAPALPQDTHDAIGALRMGILNKCYLHFPGAVWPQEMAWQNQANPLFFACTLRRSYGWRLTVGSGGYCLTVSSLTNVKRW